MCHQFNIFYKKKKLILNKYVMGTNLRFLIIVTFFIDILIIEASKECSFFVALKDGGKGKFLMRAAFISPLTLFTIERNLCWVESNPRGHARADRAQRGLSRPPAPLPCGFRVIETSEQQSDAQCSAVGGLHSLGLLDNIHAWANARIPIPQPTVPAVGDFLDDLSWKLKLSLSLSLSLSLHIVLRTTSSGRNMLGNTRSRS